MPTLPRGIQIPLLYKATVVAIEGQRYKVRVGNTITTFPLDFADTQLKSGQAVVVVNSFHAIRLFDPQISLDKNPYPIIGELLSNIRVPQDLAGLILFDPSYGNRDAMAIAKTQTKFNDLELVIMGANLPLEEIKGHYWGSNGFVGDSYVLLSPLSEVVKEPQLIGHYQREAVVIPVQGLAEPIGTSARLKPKMLEYCVEHTRL